jgi:hypothetical protein
VQFITYWLKIINSDNIILKTAMHASFELHENNNQCWASKVHGILNEYGFSDVWNNPFQYEAKYLVKLFRQRMIFANTY